jgi:hypothetical protein
VSHTRRFPPLAPTDDVRRLAEELKKRLLEYDYHFATLFAVDVGWANLADLRGDVTLTLNQATTTISHALVTADSIIILTAKTANASAEVSAGTLYATYAAGAITLTHTNSATATRTFRYQIIP